ncbi:MAG TPA: efflux RND transporter permease subunit [Gemmataceae bacterium]|nr:efflux RND transporter permease subunit [Gemmataceae bacterium]
MIDRVLAFSVRRRWLVVAAAGLLALWGARAAVRTPVDAIPDLSENQVIVFTEWPGHGPREVEDQVSYPLSLELKGLDGVRVVRSSSEVGFSSVAVIFEDRVGWEAARKQVGDALARSVDRWPAGATPRLAPDAAATGQIFWYTVEGAGYDPGRLRAIQDWYVRPQLAAVPGVAEVASVGGFPLEYQVELDPHRLRTHGIAPGQVADAVRRANAAVAGNVVHKGNAEFVARGVGWLGVRPGEPDASPDPQRVIRDLENVTVATADGSPVALAEVAKVSLGSAPRRGVLEKDGTEATGGVVLMRHGENPLDVTRRLRAKIQELQPGLPHGVRVVAAYDRTPLLRGTVGTVTRTLLEAILTATVCILVVLRHARTALVVALTLPLAVLFSFGLTDLLRTTGLLTVETNLMSLAGLAISIGVLVDSSIVMAENAMHRLKKRYGDEPVRGDTRADVLAACREVGRPIFFSVLIMLLSFLPVFALGGLEGKMFHPLAFTKSFAMIGVGLLSVTLVPALCTVFVRGRLRSEEEVGLVRGLMRVYRPVLAYLLDRPAGIVWVVGLTFVLGAAPLGDAWLRIAVATAVAASVWAAARIGTKLAAAASLVVAGLIAGQFITPLPREFLTPLDEGMAMDMPITVPRMSATQAADDLLARDMVFWRFPEVAMVVGKAGRAETATDPAPLDMIETMIDFRPREFWPRRCLRPADSERQAAAVLDALVDRGLVREPDDRRELANAAAMEAVPLFDAQMREAAYQRNREFERDLGPRQARFVLERLLGLLDRNQALTPGVAPLADSALSGHAAHLAMEPTPEAVAALVRDALRRLSELGAIEPGTDLGRLRPDPVTRGVNAVGVLFGREEPTLVDTLYEAVRDHHRERWREHTDRLNAELLDRGAGLYTRLVLEVLLGKAEVTDPAVRAAVQEWHRIRHATPQQAEGGHAHHDGRAPLPFLEPVPALDSVQTELTQQFARRLLLWPRDRVELAGFGGELDRVMQMPGWTNVWTMPIQNRVDMLATGVNTTVGVRVLGRRLEDVVRASEEIAAVLKAVPGAADVIADPVRGKGYLEVVPDRERAARLGADPGAVTDLVEIAVGGRVVTSTVEGRERHPVRVRYARAFREDDESVRDLPVMVRSKAGVAHVPLSAVADVRTTEGPASIKGENGLPRNYVRLNVRGRDASEFVADARQAVATRVKLPDGVFVEWTGQFEHEARARRTLWVAVPVVVGLIFLILWWTYRDLADAGLMLLAVPGALAGGVFFQWLLGYPLSVASWVGCIACFGMATSTGIIMLVYLRQAVANAGGIEKLTPERLRQAVLDGAAHRLRPKLLTEATTLLGLAPLLLATGPGSEVLRPMVVPVIGGLLIADEVIDLFLPVLFYRVRLRRLAMDPSPRSAATEETSPGKRSEPPTPVGG